MENERFKEIMREIERKGIEHIPYDETMKELEKHSYYAKEKKFITIPEDKIKKDDET